MSRCQLEPAQTAEWIARQLSESYGWAAAPRYIVRDRDAVYGDIFIRRLQAMGIRDRPIAARSPWQTDVIDKRFLAVLCYAVEAHERLRGEEQGLR